MADEYHGDRFEDAWCAQQGASNPVALVRVLYGAMLQSLGETKSTQAVCDDPAVRMIAHQIAHLCGIGEIEFDQDLYSKLYAECEQKKDAVRAARRIAREEREAAIPQGWDKV